jgi:hypothetical protein
MRTIIERIGKRSLAGGGRMDAVRTSPYSIDNTYIAPSCFDFKKPIVRAYTTKTNPTVQSTSILHAYHYNFT